MSDCESYSKEIYFSEVYQVCKVNVAIEELEKLLDMEKKSKQL